MSDPIFTLSLLDLVQILGVFALLALAIYTMAKLQSYFVGPNDWWAKAVIPAISLLLVHISLWWLFPEYWERFFHKTGFFVFHILIIFGFYAWTLPNKAARWMAIVLILICGFGLVRNGWRATKEQWAYERGDVELKAEQQQAAIQNNFRVGPANSAELEVKTFWMQNLPPQEAWKMIAIAKEESHFRQFEADNVTPLRGAKNPHDIGVMQINTDRYGAKAEELGYDIKTLAGNLNMALWIKNHDGDQRWNTLPTVEHTLGNQEVIPVIAPVGRWSEKYVVQGKNCQGLPDQDVRVRDSFGKVYILGPTNIPVAVTTSWEYNAIGDKPVTFTLTCFR